MSRTIDTKEISSLYINVAIRQEEIVATEQKTRKKRKYKAIRKIIVECLLHKVDVNDLAYFALSSEIKCVWYRFIDGKSFLISGTVDRKDRILDDGTYVSYVVATEVFFSEVEGKNRFLINHSLTGKVEYSDDQDNASTPHTKTLLVNYLPDELVDKIAKEISKKLKKEKVKQESA